MSPVLDFLAVWYSLTVITWGILRFSAKWVIKFLNGKTKLPEWEVEVLLHFYYILKRYKWSIIAIWLVFVPALIVALLVIFQLNFVSTG